MKKPVRYDGHACDHEILHRLPGNRWYELSLRSELSESDTVFTDLNIYTLFNAPMHFKILLEEYPNIKNIILTASNDSFDSVCYSDSFNFFCEEVLIHPTQHHHNFTVTFDWNKFNKKESMPIYDYEKNLEFLKGLYWAGNDIEIYLSSNFAIQDSQYRHWYKSLRQYYPINEVVWDNIVVSNFRPENFIEDDD